MMAETAIKLQPADIWLCTFC